MGLFAFAEYQFHWRTIYACIYDRYHTIYGKVMFF